MRPIAAFATLMVAGIIVTPHVASDWKVIVGSFFGGLAAQLITRVNLRQLATEAGMAALRQHRAACANYEETSHGK